MTWIWDWNPHCFLLLEADRLSCFFFSSKGFQFNLAVLVRVSVVMIKSFPKSTWDGKGLFHFISYTSITKGTRAGSWRHEGSTSCWLACSWWRAQPVAKGATTHRGWTLQQQSSIRKCPMGFPTGQSSGGVFSTEGPSFQLTVACVRLTYNYQQTDHFEMIESVSVWIDEIFIEVKHHSTLNFIK